MKQKQLLDQIVLEIVTLVPRILALNLGWVKKHETVSPLVTDPAVFMLIHHHLPLSRLAEHFCLVAIEPDEVAGPLRLLDTNDGLGLISPLSRYNFSQPD